MNRYRRPSLAVATLCVCLAVTPAANAQPADPLLQKAQQALVDKDVRSAQIHLKNLLKQSPSNADARSLLGQIYFAQKNYPGAAKELKIALRLGSEDPKLLLMMARAYLEQGEVQKIIDDIEIPDGASPQFRSRFVALQARAMLMKQRPVKAEQGFNHALELDPANAEAMSGLARLALMRQQYDISLEYAQRALEHDPSNLSAWNLKGDALHKLQRFDEATATYDRLLELAPENLPGLTGATGLALRNQQFEQAEKNIERALAVNEYYVPALYLQALLAYQRDDYDQATATLEKILANTRGHTPSHLLLGTIRYRQKQLEQAEEHLGLFVAKVPNHLTSRKLYAATLMKLGQPERAARVLEPALQEHPDDPQLLALLGSAAIQEGDTEDGSALLTRAVELEPEVAAFRTQLALSQLASGDTEGAIGELEIAADQGMSQADFLLALTYLKQKDFDKAIAAADALIEKLPDNPAPYNLKGAALAGRGDTAASKAAFGEALKLDPDATAARFNLARMELRAGENAQAKQRLDAILAIHPGHLGSASTRAALAMREQDTDTARQILVRAFESDRGSLKAGLLLAQYYLRSQRPAEALAVSREVASNHPQSPAAQRGLALARSASGDHHGAVSALRKAVSLGRDPDNDRYLLALAEGRAKKFSDARDNLQLLLDKDPHNHRVMAALAAAHIQLTENSQAQALAQRLQQEKPELALGYRLAGDATVATAPADAIPYYQAAVARDPSRRHFQLLYYTQARNGVSKAARATLEQWRQSHPQDPAPLLLLAADAERRQRPEDALAYYEEIVKFQPEHTTALNNAAWLLLEKGDPRSLELARRAHTLDSEQPNIADTYGLSLVRFGDPGKGVDVLQQNVSRAPHSGEFAYHYAQGLFATGRRQAAINRLKRLLDSNTDFAGKAEAEADLAAWSAAKP